MAATKPTQLPDFCTNDSITDPQSGQNNVIEPDTGNKPEGWKFQQIPPRGWMNWLHNLYYLWCKYLDEIDSDNITNASGVTGATVSDALDNLDGLIESGASTCTLISEDSVDESASNDYYYSIVSGITMLNFKSLSLSMTTGNQKIFLKLDAGATPSILRPVTGFDSGHLGKIGLPGGDEVPCNFNYDTTRNQWFLEFFDTTAGTFTSNFPSTSAYLLKGGSITFKNQA